MTETKIQILYDHVDCIRFHNVDMGYQMVQLLSADLVGPKMFVNLTPDLVVIISMKMQLFSDYIATGI